MKAMKGLWQKLRPELDKCRVSDPDYASRSSFLKAVLISCQAAIDYAHRYAALALEEAEKCSDRQRKLELLAIANNCARVPAKPARTFYEALPVLLVCTDAACRQSLPDIPFLRERFDQYMYPFYKKDMEEPA